MPSTSYATLGLLYIFNGSPQARWNYPLVVGDHWESDAGIGTGVTIKFSFPSSLPAHYYSMGGFQKFSQAQQDATIGVLKSIEELVDVDFVKTSGTGQITFANSYQPQSQGGYAYTPHYNFNSWGYEVTSVTESPIAGDVWINRNQPWDADDWKPGGDGYQTLLHEVGHALGLKHSFQGDYRVLTALDNERYTVMSYTQATNTTLVEVTGSPSSYSWQLSTLRPSTLMPMDIDALQFLYGANTSTRSGNTTYKWDTNEELLETIWDGGGTDTIDCSNQIFSNVINLEGASFSSIGLRQTDSEMRIGLDLPSWFTYSLPLTTYDGSNNLAIARGVVIENAKGGSARDVISGNAAANNLAGGAGDDTLAGLGGDDVLNGGTGADSMTGGKGNDTFHVDHAGDIVKESSSGGSDVVWSYLTNYTLGSQVESGRVMSGGSANLTGNSLDNLLYAGSGNNLLSGGGGSDTVSYAYAKKAVTASLAVTAAQATGGSGSDRFASIENLVGSAYGDKLTGNSGANRLAGGEGRDTLTGGGGKDIFDFDTLAEMGTSKSQWDVITDFARGKDDIDLSTLDAKSGTRANDAFQFIGSSAFSAAGQLRYVWNDAKDYGVLYGNTDSDSAAEFAIQVSHVKSLSAGDFIA